MVEFMREYVLIHFIAYRCHLICLPTPEHGRPDDSPNNQALQDKLSNHLIGMCRDLQIEQR